MAISKEMEDWFLRGGERPKNGNEQTQTPVVTCQNCGGDNLADEEYCTHCGAALAGGTSTAEYCGDEPELRVFVVTMTRTKSVEQEARVTVRATSEEEAMEKAEDAACEESDGWTWTDCPPTVEYEDCQAEGAEEV